MAGNWHYVNGCVVQGRAELRGMEQGGEAHALTRIQACPTGAILAVLEDLTLVILCFPDFVPKQPHGTNPLCQSMSSGCTGRFLPLYPP